MEQTRGINTATNVNVSNFKPLVSLMVARKRKAEIHLKSKYRLLLVKTSITDMQQLVSKKSTFDKNKTFSQNSSENVSLPTDFTAET